MSIISHPPPPKSLICPKPKKTIAKVNWEARFNQVEIEIAQGRTWQQMRKIYNLSWLRVQEFQHRIESQKPLEQREAKKIQSKFNLTLTQAWQIWYQEVNTEQGCIRMSEPLKNATKYIFGWTDQGCDPKLLKQILKNRKKYLK